MALCGLAAMKFNIGLTTILGWYKTYDEYGKFPDVLKKKFENLRKKNGGKFRMMQRW
jgi:hypothetical protein